MTSGAFKTGKDGRKLFYPWGVFGRGYAIPTDEAYERLHLQFKIYMIVSLALIIGAVFFHPIGGLIAAAVSIAFFAAWMPFLRRGLEPSDEKMTVKESVTTQARTHNALTLWLLTIASLGFVAIGIFILVVEPHNWMIALAPIGFFGMCAAVMIWMLVLRRRMAGV